MPLSPPPNMNPNENTIPSTPHPPMHPPNPPNPTPPDSREVGMSVPVVPVDRHQADPVGA